MTAPPRVLFMDDDSDLLVLVARMARILNVELVGTGHAEETIRTFVQASDSGRPFDAVILDLTIPGSAGAVEVIAALREIDPDIPAIVTSGYSEGGVMAAYREHGFSAALPKPFVAKDLGETLDRVLGNVQGISK